MTYESVPRGSNEADADRPIQAVTFTVQFHGEHVRAGCGQCNYAWDWPTVGYTPDITARLELHARRCMAGIPLDAPVAAGSV